MLSKKQRVKRMLMVFLMLVTIIILAACTDTHSSEKRTFVLAYQEYSGKPVAPEEGAYLSFDGEGHFMARLSGCDYNFSSYYLKDGQFTAVLDSYNGGAGRVYTRDWRVDYPKTITGYLSGDILILPDVTQNASVFWQFDYVFVEKGRYQSDQAKPEPPADNKAVATGLIGRWSSGISGNLIFNDNWTGLKWNDEDSYQAPFTWSVENGVLTISYSQYYPTTFVRQYDFVDNWDGYFLRLYDLDQNPNDEMFYSVLYRKVE